MGIVDELRDAVWDGTGLTLEELPDDWQETVRWRDTGMTLEEFEEFLLSEDESPSFRRRKR